MSKVKLIPLGTQFGRWTVISQAPSRKQTSGKFMTYWNMLCSCGVAKEVSGVELRRGRSQSCGCLLITHGMTYTPTYEIWCGVIKRCTNPEHIDWHNYGGRGITFDPRWEKFVNFYEDMGPRPEGLVLDRRDNSGNYTKENCRWVTQTVNCRNKRNNSLVEYEGRMITVAEASEITGINPQTLRSRMLSKNKDVFRK